MVQRADALSRRGYAEGDGAENDTVDDYFDAKLYSTGGKVQTSFAIIFPIHDS